MADKAKKGNETRRKGRNIDPIVASKILSETFALAEIDSSDPSAAPSIEKTILDATERLFSSKTQAYRDALPSCVLARILDPEIDISLPATEYGENAFSGRSINERVVRPFFVEHAIPSSKAPFLSAVRGGARFIAGGEPRIQRDKEGFDALVAIVTYLREGDEVRAKDYLRYLLGRFIQLRESANISLKKIAKPNLEQLNRLICGLLEVKSGGRFASFLATAFFQTISDCYSLNWEVEFQGINVADKASGAVGDITIRKDGSILLGVEVTERPVQRARVTTTFDEKISSTGLSDYLFLVTATPDADAVSAAISYTAVGHEMNFVQLADWLVNNLATIGPKCRSLFQSKMIDLLSTQNVPVDVKLAWNIQMDIAIGINPSGESAL
jgi:SacI restriction endonuclease